MTSKKKASKINQEEKRGVGWWKRYEQPPLNDKYMNHTLQREAEEGGPYKVYSSSYPPDPQCCPQWVVWLSGLRRWIKAPVCLEDVGSNPTAAKCSSYFCK